MNSWKKVYRFIKRKFFRKNNIPDFHKFIECEKGSNTSGLNLQVREPIGGKKFMTIGSGCVVNGLFVCERSESKINIGHNTFIGGGMFVCINSIEIGNDVMFSWGCTVMDSNAHSLVSRERKNDVLDWKRGIEEGHIGRYKDWSNVKSDKIIIRDKAWVGFNCIILKGVTIGEGAVVAAGSVITKDIPDYAVVAGNPAQIIKYTT